jgi:type IV secretion system protein VirB3
MRFATRRDDQRFRQIFLALKLRRADRNQSFWQARSYAPYPFRGGTDAWHR